MMISVVSVLRSSLTQIRAQALKHACKEECPNWVRPVAMRWILHDRPEPEGNRQNPWNLHDRAETLGMGQDTWDTASLVEEAGFAVRWCDSVLQNQLRYFMEWLNA